ncbi:Zinc finger protein castor, partial [Plakobranchus ocellatus]
MSTFSLGKLDAICARLKSHHQPQSVRDIYLDNGVNTASHQSLSAQRKSCSDAKATVACPDGSSAIHSARDNGAPPTQSEGSIGKKTPEETSVTTIDALEPSEKQSSLSKDVLNVLDVTASFPRASAHCNNNNSKITDFNIKDDFVSSLKLHNSDVSLASPTISPNKCILPRLRADVSQSLCNSSLAIESWETNTSAPSRQFSPPSVTSLTEEILCKSPTLHYAELSSATHSSKSSEIISRLIDQTTTTNHHNLSFRTGNISSQSHSSNFSESPASVSTSFLAPATVGEELKYTDTEIISEGERHSSVGNKESQMCLYKENVADFQSEVSQKGQCEKQIEDVGFNAARDSTKNENTTNKETSVKQAIKKTICCGENNTISIRSLERRNHERSGELSDDTIQGAKCDINRATVQPVAMNNLASCPSTGDVLTKQNSLKKQENAVITRTTHAEDKVFEDAHGQLSRQAKASLVPGPEQTYRLTASSPQKQNFPLKSSYESSKGNENSFEIRPTEQLEEPDNTVLSTPTTEINIQSKDALKNLEDAPKTRDSIDNLKLRENENHYGHQSATCLETENVSAGIESSTNKQILGRGVSPSLCNNSERAVEQGGTNLSRTPSANQPVALTGRKKSRKATRPQRQPVRSHMVMDSDFPYDISSSDPTHVSHCPSTSNGPYVLSFERDTFEVAKTEDWGTSSPSGGTPLDLSASDPIGSSCPEAAPESHAMVNSTKNEGFTLTGISVTKDGDHQGETRQDRQKAQSLMENPGVEPSAESKGLVDFAHNTMQELLGIYGLDESDAKGMHLNRLKSCFRDDSSSQPAAFVNGSSQDVAQVPQRAIGHRKSLIRKSLVKHAAQNKPRPFRKNVYTSLTHHGVQASSSSNVLALSPVANSLSSEQFQLIGSSCSSSNNSNDSTSCTPSLTNVCATATSASSGRSASFIGAKKAYLQRPVNSSDLNKYIKRYASSEDCSNRVCEDMGYKDHYHCLDCPMKVFIRKEEMVRHYKWHKKRQNSLQHGFMRYSPVDDCSIKYRACAHNGRQTHYHCVQHNCDKVYVSTSDVQMHANFHRKDSAIIQEGFQRFRATEDCGTPSCAFYGHRTTHFHCRRPQCNFTFKNKADMEKHKSYHQKDEVLSKDGFKKFMKYETCPYPGCRFSKINNHIHCIRPGCQYVLHSTAQLYSHKRKHERREFEHAYRNYRQLQQNKNKAVPMQDEQTSHLPLPLTLQSHSLQIGERNEKALASTFSPSDKMQVLPTALDLVESSNGKGQSSCDSMQPMECMALPVQVLSSRGVKGNRPLVQDVESDEPEDLSLPHRKRKLSSDQKEELGVPTKAVKQEDTEVKQVDTVPIAQKNHASHNGAVGGDDEDDDDYDDDDDDDDEDDDDDKDYGQVEEPTLVNPCFGSGMDAERMENSLDLSIEKIRMTEPTLETDVSVKQEVKSDSNNMGMSWPVAAPVLNHWDLKLDSLSLSRSSPSQKTFQPDNQTPVIESSKVLGISGNEVFRGITITSGSTGNSKQRQYADAKAKIEVTQNLSTADVVVSSQQSVSANSDSTSGIVQAADSPHSASGILIKSALPCSNQSPQAFLNPQGRVWGLHIPIKLVSDKRDRDESWKKYLV